MSWKSVEFTLSKHILGKLVFLLALLWTPNFSPNIYIYISGVDTGSFLHRYTDFGHTNLDLLKFNPYLKIK